MEEERKDPGGRKERSGENVAVKKERTTGWRVKGREGTYLDIVISHDPQLSGQDLPVHPE